MSQAPSMPVFTDALIGDTLRLSAEEFGCYCLLLFATWRNNGAALPDDTAELAQICRVTPARWRAHMRPKLVRFFDITDGFWHQKRLEKEWKNVQAKVLANRANGIKGGRPPKNPTSAPDKTQIKPTGSDSDNPDETQTEPIQSQSQKKLASYLDSRELPRGELPSEWGEAAASERAKEGLPEVDLPAEWAKFISRVDEEPTLGRWLGWAMKARAQRPGNGSTNPAGLPEEPWPQRCRAWAKGRRWEPKDGPAPDEPGCWAPADLVAEAIRQRNGKLT